MEDFRLLPRPSQEPKQSKQFPHRVFVGGLPKKATNESLLNYFLKFGRLTECKIVQDSQTHLNKNFAFVAFESKEVYDRVLALDPVKHKYLNAVLSIKACVDKVQVDANKKDEANRKVSLFNIPHQTKVEDLRKKLQAYFGEIEQIDQFFHKGFAFVLFKNRESAESLIQSGTFKVNGVLIEPRRFLTKEDGNNQKQTQAQVSSREPSSTQNARGHHALSSQKSQVQYQHMYREPASQTLHNVAQNQPQFGFFSGTSAPSNSNIAVNLGDDKSGEVPQTRDRSSTVLSSVISENDAKVFKEMGKVVSEAVENNSLHRSQQATSDKRIDSSLASSKNESAQSRIRADQEKTISFLLDDEDDTKREVPDSVKPEDHSSTTVSKLASNFNEQAADYRYKPLHENGKLFSMFEQKSSDIQAGLDKLLFKSEILGDSKPQSDHIKSTTKKHLEFE